MGVDRVEIRDGREFTVEVLKEVKPRRRRNKVGGTKAWARSKKMGLLPKLRLCPTCGKHRPVSAFPKNRRRKTCLVCLRAPKSTPIRNAHDRLDEELEARLLRD